MPDVDSNKAREELATSHVVPPDPLPNTEKSNDTLTLSWDDSFRIFETGDIAEFSHGNVVKIVTTQGYDTIDSKIRYIVAEEN
eukprot:5933085-Ditylum_brightwellii.AAC.1